MRIEKLSEAAAEIQDSNLTSKILDGDLEYVKNYFTNNPKDIKKKLVYGQDIIAFSVYANDKPIFDWLMSNGAKPGVGADGLTALHQATFNADPYFMKKLIAFGMKIDRKTKKVPTALVFMIENILNAEHSMGGSLSGSDKNKKAEKMKKTFKALVDGGASLYEKTRDDWPIFPELVKNGIFSFVKIMVSADKNIINEKLQMHGYDSIDLALVNYHSEIVDYFLDMGLEPDRGNKIHFITRSSDTKVAMKIYNMLSDDDKNEVKIENMLYVDKGKEKMIKLMKSGVRINQRFIENERVQAIAEELMQTNRADELMALGAEHNVMEFMSAEVKDIFMF